MQIKEIQQDKITALQIALRSINSIEIIGEALCAVLKMNFSKDSLEDVTKEFRRFLIDLTDLSKNICKKLHLDPDEEENLWIRNQIEKSCIKLIGELTVNKKEWCFESISETIVSAVKQEDKIGMDIEIKNFVVEKLSNNHFNEKLGLISSCSILLSNLNTNTLYRNIHKDIPDIIEILVEKTKYAIRKYFTEEITADHYNKLFNTILLQATQVYISVWQAEGKRITEVIDKGPKDKIEKIILKYKDSGGFPINKINQDFDNLFNVVLTLTKKLTEIPKENRLQL